MDFIDNLLNHMSSKFNQESTIPKQAEISMDETFKWRALKNNQFACRSKNGRLKVKSKDKTKQQTTNTKADDELEAIDDANTLSSSAEDLGDSSNIEIEIANDISNAEIQEALASSQSVFPVLAEESNVDQIDLQRNDEGTKDSVESTSPSRGEPIIDISSSTPANAESVTLPIQLDVMSGEQEEESNLKTGEEDQPVVSVDENVMESNTSIFMHMSSTFNGTHLVKQQSEDDNNSKKSLEVENQNTLSDDTKSNHTKETPSTKQALNISKEENILPAIIRRSKRLQQDLHFDDESKAVEVVTTQPKESSEAVTLPSDNASADSHVESLPVITASNDKTLRILRNKSITLEAREPVKRKMKRKLNITEEESSKSSPISKKDAPHNVEEVLVKHIVKREPMKNIAKSTSSKSETRILRKRRSTAPEVHTVNVKRNIKLRSRLFNNKNTGAINVKAKSKINNKSKIRNESHKNKSIQQTPQHLTKRSQRLSKDGSEGILASAIARKEKQDVSGIQGRLSRPIKLSAKILANDELRYGFELQNSARLNLNAEVKQVQNNKTLNKVEVTVSPDKPEVIPQQVAPKASPKAVEKQIEPVVSIAQTSKCREPQDLINEVKEQKLCSNRSPECDSKLNKLQQRQLLRLKEKHLFLLGLRRIDDQTFVPDTIKRINKEKPLLKPQPKSSDTAKQSIVDNKVVTEKQRKECKSNINLAPFKTRTKFICSCQKRTRYFTTKTKNRMYCTAIDDINGQTVGCCNELKGELQSLLRPSSRTSYQLLCITHRRRLHHHGCCAACGVYCTQGNFVICSNKHLFHRDCAEKFIINTEEKSSTIVPKLVLKCPHCALETVVREYSVRFRWLSSARFVPSRV